MAHEEIKVIDVMNYYFIDIKSKFLERSREVRDMFGVMYKGALPGIYKGLEPEGFIAEMDAAGFEKAFICAFNKWQDDRSDFS